MVYLVLLLLLVYCSIKFTGKDTSDKSYKDWLWICSIFMIAIAALRFEIGADTALSYMPNYEKYNDIAHLSLDDFDATDYQPGWLVLIALCKYVTPDFYFFQFIHALILNLSILFFLKNNCKSIFVALLSYFLINYLEFNTECLRESMSISFVLIAFEMYKRKKYILTISLAFVAFNFHVSAIGALIIPFIHNIKFSRRSFAIISIIAIVSPFIYQMLPDQAKFFISVTGKEDLVNWYNNREFSTTLNINYYIQHVVYYVFIPMFLVLYNLKKGGGKYIGYAYAFSILQMLAVFSYGFYRFSNYVAPFYWMLIAECAYYFFSSSKKKPIFPFVMMVIIGCYICQGRLLGPDSDSRMNASSKLYERYFPYKTWINEDKNYK